mgnify:CR=1 FL=1
MDADDRLLDLDGYDDCFGAALDSNESTGGF